MTHIQICTELCTRVDDKNSLDFLLVPLAEEHVPPERHHGLVVLLVDLVPGRILVQQLGPGHPHGVRSVVRF